ncbi:MAG: GNAT family N-acetyltransferase [Acidobacteriia bacterium]|nr:GNAT family N-acetyltransferase [Terriglobia bacterium]
MIAITQLNKEQWYAVSPRQDREWAKNWGIYALYAEDGLHQLAVDGEPVSFHATYFAKGKKADGWGKYANFYLAYTLPAYRRNGYATLLYNHVMQEALMAGMFRVKSLVQSDLGYYLHRGLGHKFWGVEKQGHLVVDEPLITRNWPEGIPKKARAALDPHVLGRDELYAILLKPPFNMVGNIADVV